ncbi:hypothetical protein BDZ89DRAFT_1061003 [Hymenopellis radicata]|nr:hypothetical protein BDZ89DRAFT_1061003 [Hymenopellis radicata]
MSSRPKIKRDRVKEPSSSKTTLDTPSKTSSRRKQREKSNGEDKSADFAAGVDFISIDDSDDGGKEKRRSKRRHSDDDDTDRTSSKRYRKRKEREPESKSAPAEFRTGADFIAIPVSDDDNEDEEEPQKKPAEREWDKGKPRRRSRDRDEHRRRERAKYEPRAARYTSNWIPWLDGVNLDDCKNVTEVLHREVSAFTKWMSPTQGEDEIRGLVVEQIRRAVTSAVKDARVEPFGSYATKLYLPSGDIDLVILSESMRYNDRVNVLHSLASTLKRARVTDRVSIIAKAKVPIVKFVSTHGHFNVDISINQPNGLVGVNIVNGFLQDMHGSIAMRALVLITKLFLSQRGMNEVYSGGLGSYAIVCLVVSFLQMHPKVRRAEIDVDQNLGVLVMEFFELYGCYFNYNEAGISVRDGGTYFSKRQRGWFNDTRGLLLSIEDPADPSNDISSGSFGFSKVKATMAGAFGILTSTAYTRAGIINARRTGEALRLRERYEAADLSILSSIMNVPQETVNHRRVVEEVYQSGELHAILEVEFKPRVTVFDKSVDSKGNGARRTLPDLESDMDLDSDREEHGRKRLHSDEEEDMGRYDIGRRPPSKRRKVGTMKDDTVFTTDDEEEEEDYSGDEETARDYILSAGIGLGEEEEEDAPFPSGRKSRQSSKPPSVNRERNRVYWMSKGGGSGPVSSNGGSEET